MASAAQAPKVQLMSSIPFMKRGELVPKPESFDQAQSLLIRNGSCCAGTVLMQPEDEAVLFRMFSYSDYWSKRLHLLFGPGKFDQYGYCHIQSKWRISTPADEGLSVVGYSKVDKTDACIMNTLEYLVAIPNLAVNILPLVLTCGFFTCDFSLLDCCCSEICDAEKERCDYTPDWVFLSEQKELELRMKPRKICCGCLRLRCCAKDCFRTEYDIIAVKRKVNVGTVVYDDERYCYNLCGRLDVLLNFDDDVITDEEKLKMFYLVAGWNGDQVVGSDQIKHAFC